jgi:hypothetical protein
LNKSLELKEQRIEVLEDRLADANRQIDVLKKVRSRLAACQFLGATGRRNPVWFGTGFGNVHAAQ